MAARKDRPRGAALAPTDGAAVAAAAPAAADEAGGGGVWRYIRPTTLAKLVVWAVLQVIFYRLEFGLVFFIASCFYWVWDSMSSSSSSALTVDGERVSAYSVFNRGVNALPGTLNANEFDNMMRGGFAPPPGGEEEKRPAVGGMDDYGNDEEDQAIQRAAMASLKHRKAATEQQKTKAKKPPPATTKARTYASSSSSSSSSVAAPKPLVFDSDLQALMRSVAKP